MSEMNHICLYLDYLPVLKTLSDHARGKLMIAMLRFAAKGEEPELTGPARYVWPVMRNQILRDREKYRLKCEQNRVNGKKGGRPPKKPDGFEKTQEKEEG